MELNKIIPPTVFILAIERRGISPMTEGLKNFKSKFKNNVQLFNLSKKTSLYFEFKVWVLIPFQCQLNTFMFFPFLATQSTSFVLVTAKFFFFSQYLLTYRILYNLRSCCPPQCIFCPLQHTIWVSVALPPVPKGLVGPSLVRLPLSIAESPSTATMHTINSVSFHCPQAPLPVLSVLHTESAEHVHEFGPTSPPHVRQTSTGTNFVNFLDSRLKRSVSWGSLRRWQRSKPINESNCK